MNLKKAFAAIKPHWFLIACMLVILSYIALAYYAFAQRDDFIFANYSKDQSALDVAHEFYLAWTGRFSAVALEAFVVKSPLFPFQIGSIILLGMFFFVLGLLYLSLRCDGKFSQAIIADVAFLLLVLPTDVKKETFYWFTGHLTYIFPLTLGIWLIHSLSGLRAGIIEYAILAGLFALSVLMAGFNEQLTIMFLVALSGYVFLSYCDNRVLSRRGSIVILGLLVGFIIDIMAPGNYVRLQKYNNNSYPNIFGIASATINQIYYFIPEFFFACFVYGTLRGHFYPSSYSKIFDLKHALPRYVLISLLALLSGFYFVIFGYNGNWVSARALLLPYTLLFFMAVMCGVYFSKPLISCFMRRGKNRVTNLLMALLILAVALKLPLNGFSILASSAIQAKQTRYMAWDQMRMASKVEGIERLGITVVPAVRNNDNLLHYRTLQSDPMARHNRAFADYYGLRGIKAQ